jgi:hypothetical protein
MLNWAADPNLKKYGLKVTTSRTVVEARVLQAPKVQYGTGVANPGTSGRWDLKGKKFLQPNTAPLKSWSVTVISGKRGGKPDKSSLENFVKEFVKVRDQNPRRCPIHRADLNTRFISSMVAELRTPIQPSSSVQATTRAAS